MVFTACRDPLLRANGPQVKVAPPFSISPILTFGAAGPPLGFMFYCVSGSLAESHSLEDLGLIAFLFVPPLTISIYLYGAIPALFTGVVASILLLYLRGVKFIFAIMLLGTVCSGLLAAYHQFELGTHVGAVGSFDSIPELSFAGGAASLSCGLVVLRSAKRRTRDAQAIEKCQHFTSSNFEA